VFQTSTEKLKPRFGEFLGNQARVLKKSLFSNKEAKEEEIKEKEW
jgi:hypothetical protein